MGHLVRTSLFLSDTFYLNGHPFRCAGVLPRKDGLGTPPIPRVFLLLHLMAPKHFEHKHRTFNGPTLEDVGHRVGGCQFWGVFGNAVLAKNAP